MASKKVVEIFTDGGYRASTNKGGWGVLLSYAGVKKTLKGAEFDTTNNRMELTAVIKALSALKRHSDVNITTDSQYVKLGITVWINNWKKNNWRTSNKKPVKNLDLWLELDQLCQQHNVKFFWVKAHSGHVENELVDNLANQAMDELN